MRRLAGIDPEPLRLVLDDLCSSMRDHGPEARSWPGYFVVPPMIKKDGEILLPRLDYGPKMDRMWRAFSAAGWERPRPGDVVAAYANRLRFHPLDVGQLDLDIRAVLDSVYLSGLVNDDEWAAALRQGMFRKIAMTWLTRLAYPDE